MKFPKPVSKLIDFFERLPGIGPKTAQRLTFYLLHFPEDEIRKFADALVGLKTGTKSCSICKNISEHEVCEVCDDPLRNKKQIAVVASPLDAMAVEKTGFKGVYHVLHGLIDPLNNLGPDDIFIKELKERVNYLNSEFDFTNMINDGDNNNAIELILATNTSMEGESTAMYIVKMFRDLGLDNTKLKLSRIARGLPVGGDIEYADDITLTRALEGRSQY